MKFSTGKHKIVKDRLKIFPLILKVAENLRETLFRECWIYKRSLETWRHNDIQKKILNEVEMVD